MRRQHRGREWTGVGDVGDRSGEKTQEGGAAGGCRNEDRSCQLNAELRAGRRGGCK